VEERTERGKALHASRLPRAVLDSAVNCDLLVRRSTTRLSRHQDLTFTLMQQSEATFDAECSGRRSISVNVGRFARVQTTISVDDVLDHQRGHCVTVLHRVLAAVYQLLIVLGPVHHTTSGLFHPDVC